MFARSLPKICRRSNLLGMETENLFTAKVQSIALGISIVTRIFAANRLHILHVYRNLIVNLHREGQDVRNGFGSSRSQFANPKLISIDHAVGQTATTSKRPFSTPSMQFHSRYARCLEMRFCKGQPLLDQYRETTNTGRYRLPHSLCIAIIYI